MQGVRAARPRGTRRAPDEGTGEISYRVTIPCTRAQGEAIGSAEDLFLASEAPPVVVADEPDETKPDEWVIHAYFEAEPTSEELIELRGLGSGEPEIEHLEDSTDWITKSQQGLQPIRAGRFFVHTPMHYVDRPADTVNFEIDAGLAFGTGQHATTAGCLDALDRLAVSGAAFANIADIGTGTGLLAFAALALWPEARCIATDIDPVAIDVSRENAAINGVKTGHNPGELLLAVADGMDSPMLAARAPFDLLIANILAGPLIELAPTFAKSLASGGTVILAGLLDTQADAVAAAYQAQGLQLIDLGHGEWPVVELKAP
ncbi:50S ribosomal protein L11 methyltransferase [Sphingomonas daechungensis]|uniref:50S ribosomal protein L11 methyltransferase n=1 Tax=Sphingomonas daechungensis TaxID=1176646 RepID=UPI003784F49C